VDAFFGVGVIRVEYVAAFPDQRGFAVWLDTATDSEAVRLRISPTIRAGVHELLVRHGFEVQDLGAVMVVVQSQEPVDRGVRR
jgi:hypothetical protein